MNTEKKLLKEADSRVQDAIKALSSAKASFDEGDTTIKMNLSHQFIKLYEEDLNDLSDKIENVTESVEALARKIRIQLKQ
jgi:hypothetical protein